MEKANKRFRADLLPASWLLLITFIVASSAGCRTNSHGHTDEYETAKIGQSFSYAVGWFDSVTITYKEEKYEIRSELLSEAERPGGWHPMGYLKAFVYHRRCIRQSTNKTLEDDL